MPYKGKGKESEIAVLNVKLGRYACLVEFIIALETAEEGVRSGRQFRAFIEDVEARLGPMLQAEVSRLRGMLLIDRNANMRFPTSIEPYSVAYFW